MFENRSEKQQIIIYAIIALLVTIVLGIYHYYTYRGFFSNPYVIIIVGNVEFFCIFYILYLPLKVKKAREKREEKNR